MLSEKYLARILDQQVIGRKLSLCSRPDKQLYKRTKEGMMPEEANQLIDPEFQPHEDRSGNNGVGASFLPLSVPHQAQQPPFGQQLYLQSPPNTYYPPQQWQQTPMMPPLPNKKPNHTQRNAWLIIGAVVLAFMFFAVIAGANQSTQTTTPTTQVTQPASTGQQPTIQPQHRQHTPTTKTFAQFGDGMFQVDKDIQSGTYRTRIGSPGCYYARLRGFDTQAIISNNNTDAPAVVTIAATDKAFESSNCGMWTKDLSAITTSKTSFGDGIFIVGTDIKPGTYKNSGSSGCYYARLSAFDTQAIISNDNTDAGAIITIAATDKAFESSNCGMWTKQ